ncbi:hypothetical protein FE257_003555 [Aspergillus nanangensis]|uniref:Uncharacterized protein n=1 Tax=Aspergillus nanangensis TaxID=2582783 RepID=A0AAD4CBD5_ASPNN|nr:hypothetical protein FE257_003555 [Aspergillus nanangensis]
MPTVQVTKGDGRRPICERCGRASRPCSWLEGGQGPSQSPSASPLPASVSSSEDLQYVSATNPAEALQHPQVAEIFRHYIDHLAGWYDLNDRNRHFGDVVPICARHNSLLLSAILAFSAAALSSSSPGLDLWAWAESYHLESVQQLLSLTKDVDQFRTGETLAAICLLRSYEIISQNVSCQNHLQGSYSLLSSGSADLASELFNAGFWNYLREDITVALIEKRGLMIELSDAYLPQTVHAEDDFANRVTYLLGRVMNHCLGANASPLARPQWETLRSELEAWKSSLPPSFEPISTPGLHGKSVFPSLWTTSPWHASSLQYYHTGMAILHLAEPASPTANALQQMERVSTLNKTLEHHAVIVCALALSSHSAPVWVNSFGQISFCGPWIKDQQMLKEVLAAMQKWGRNTGWPVGNILASLS